MEATKDSAGTVSPDTLAEVQMFIDSAVKVFNVMLNMDVEVGGLKVGTEASEGAMTEDRIATSVIGLKGSDSWNLELKFDEKCSQVVAQKLVQTDEVLSECEISDALAELSNMVGGGAKGNLSVKRNEELALGLPTVVLGGDYYLPQRADSQTVSVPFHTELFDFLMRVTFVKR